MVANAHSLDSPALPPPRSETGAIGWARENLFNSRFNGVLTVLAAIAIILTLWFSIRWAASEADWKVVTRLGSQFVIGQYNTESACPGQNCAWRPQVGLLLGIFLLGMAWGVAGKSIAKPVALTAAIAVSAMAFVPYSLDRMGWDTRLLLLANLPAVFAGLALARYTPLGNVRGIILAGVAAFSLTLVLLGGWVPGLQPVPVLRWGGLLLNVILAVAGIALSLPIGILLALGRRSHLPVVKTLCVVFIEVFRGVPLITLLFMSQVVVPLAFPQDFSQNSLFRAAIVITLFSSAYMAENIRGGLQSLHPGQAEAARALGLHGWQITFLISLPQAIRNVIPAIVGQFIALFKDTSLVYIIGMLDVVEIGRAFIQGNPEYLASAKELFIFLAIVFWIFTYGMSYVSRRVEQNLGVGTR